MCGYGFYQIYLFCFVLYGFFLLIGVLYGKVVGVSDKFFLYQCIIDMFGSCLIGMSDIDSQEFYFIWFCKNEQEGSLMIEFLNLIVVVVEIVNFVVLFNVEQVFFGV